MNQPAVGVTAYVRSPDGMVLLGRKGPKTSMELDGRSRVEGQWLTPGGRVEWGETLLEATVREVREETGLDVLPTGLLFVEEIFRWSIASAEDARGLEAHYVLHVMDAHVPILRSPVPGDDLVEVEWVNADRVAQLWAQMTPLAREIFRRYPVR